MPCPHCGHELTPSALSCAECGFDLAEAQRLLGRNWVKVERLIDHAQCLSLRDTHHLNLWLDEMERRFPQVLTVVFFGNLPEGVIPSESAFWLLNHAAAVRHDLARSGHWGIALILDVAKKRAGLALGYALEALLPAELPQKLLQAAIPHFANGELARGVRSVMEGLEKPLLRCGTSKARQTTDQPAPRKSHMGLETVPPNTPTMQPSKPAKTLPPRRP